MRVAIVEGHTLLRKGMAALLMNEQNVEVVGEAATVSEAADLVRQVKPEVVLTDNQFRDGSCLDIIKRCQEICNSCKFIELTTSASEVEFKQACQAGVDGYVLKNALPEELVYAMRLVCQGRKYYDPMVMDYVMKHDNNPVEELTPRELEVLLALGKGLSNSLIAKTLYISEFTVKKHISQILSKLNLHDRTQAALFANEKGLGK